MSGVSRQSGTCATSGPGHLVAVAERRIGGGEQAIALAIERHAGDAPDRLIVEVGHARIDFEDFREDRRISYRRARPDCELHVRVLGTVRRGQRGNHRQAPSAPRRADALPTHRPLRSASTSSCMARVSPTIRRAHSSTRCPSGVKPWKREPRLTSRTPNNSSSCLMPADNVGCVTPEASAARPKCFSRAKAKGIRACRAKRLILGAGSPDPAKMLNFHQLTGDDRELLTGSHFFDRNCLSGDWQAALAISRACRMLVAWRGFNERHGGAPGRARSWACLPQSAPPHAEGPAGGSCRGLRRSPPRF